MLYSLNLLNIVHTECMSEMLYSICELNVVQRVCDVGDNQVVCSTCNISFITLYVLVLLLERQVPS